MADPGTRETDAKLRELEQRLKVEYEQAKRDIEKKIQLYNDRFKVKDRTWQRWVADGTKTKQQYKDWLTGQIAIGKRWEELKDNISEDLLNYRQIAKSISKGYQKDVYAINHNYGTFEVEQGSGLDTSYTLYDRQTVEKLYRDNPQILPDPGSKLSDKIARGEAKRWEKRHIQSCMMQAILQGMDISSVATILANTCGETDRKAAIRDARTMVTCAQNAGRIDSYKRANAMGITTRKQWLATLDSRTRHEHRMLDGLIQDVDGFFQVGDDKIRFPGDPEAASYLVWNCRCTLIAALKGFEHDIQGTEGRDTTKLDHDSYEAWKKDKKEKTLGILRPDEQREKYRSRYIREYRGFGGPVAPDDAFDDQYAESRDMTFAQASTFKDKIDSIRGRVGTGTPTESDIKEAGKALSEEFNEYRKSYREAWENAVREWEEYERVHGNDGTDEYRTLFDRVGTTYDEYHGTFEDNAKWLKNKLSEVREVGTSGLKISKHLGGKRTTKQLVQDVYDYYPKSWVEKSINGNKMYVDESDRGAYSHGYKDSFLWVSGDSASKRLEVTIHELGHRFEHVIPGMVNAEKEYYNQRTAGEDLKWLGIGYRPDEKARRDKFISPYMGKEYGDGYELVSMGFQYAYTDPALLATDEDMESWIYGLLCLM